jgi:hypothetical protein
MPTPTDLVTNLPADFEVFGQAVDSDFADLKGGTTGQVLAKASNADLDFVWSADAAGMTNPMTTTGDTIYSSSGSTPARLGIGSTGQVLTVASGIPSWQTPAGGGGMTLLSTTSLTSNTNTISSISNAYKNLVILIRGSYGSVDNQQVRFRLNGDSGANYAYGAVGVRLGGAGVIGNTSGTSDTNVFFGNGHNANAFNKQLNADMVIYRYTTSQPTYYEWNSMSAADATNSNWIMFSGAGTYNSSAAVSSITFYCDNGTWSGGTVYIYGVN